MESRYCRQSLLKWILFWVRSSPRTFFGKFPISATKKGLTIPVTPNPIHLELFAVEIQKKVGVRAKLRDLGFRRWGGGGGRIILVVFVSFLKYLGNNIEDVFFPYSPQSARGQLRKIPWKISFCTITLKKSYTLSQKSARYQRKSAREPQFFSLENLKGKVPVNKSAIEHTCEVLVHVPSSPRTFIKCCPLISRNVFIYLKIIKQWWLMYFFSIFFWKSAYEQKKVPGNISKKIRFRGTNIVDGKNTLQEGGRWSYRWEKKADVTGGTCVYRGKSFSKNCGRLE